MQEPAKGAEKTGAGLLKGGRNSPEPPVRSPLGPERTPHPVPLPSEGRGEKHRRSCASNFAMILKALAGASDELVGVGFGEQAGAAGLEKGFGGTFGIVLLLEEFPEGELAAQIGR